MKSGFLSKRRSIAFGELTRGLRHQCGTAYHTPMGGHVSRAIAVPGLIPGSFCSDGNARTDASEFGTMITPVPAGVPWKLARYTVTLDRTKGRPNFGAGLVPPRRRRFFKVGEAMDSRSARKDWTKDSQYLQGLELQTFSFRGEPLRRQEIRAPTAVQSLEFQSGYRRLDQEKRCSALSCGTESFHQSQSMERMTPRTRSETLIADTVFTSLSTFGLGFNSRGNENSGEDC